MRSRSASGCSPSISMVTCADDQRQPSCAARRSGSVSARDLQSPGCTGTATSLVLMGDASHTAHFSIGSGTKLALEDATELANSFKRHGNGDMRATMADYEAVRGVEVLKIQNAARKFDGVVRNVERYTGMDAEQFTIIHC